MVTQFRLLKEKHRQGTKGRTWLQFPGHMEHASLPHKHAEGKKKKNSAGEEFRVLEGLYLPDEDTVVHGDREILPGSHTTWGQQSHP